MSDLLDAEMSTSNTPVAADLTPTMCTPIGISPTIDSPTASTLLVGPCSADRSAVDTPVVGIPTADALTVSTSIAGSPATATPPADTPGAGTSVTDISTAILTPAKPVVNIFSLVRSKPYDEVVQSLQDPAQNWNVHQLYYTRQRTGETASQNVIFSAITRHIKLGHHLDLLKFFHEAGVDMKHKDGRSQTALFHAAASGLTDCVEFMLFAGDNDPNESDSIGETPLFYAARKGHAETVDLLLKSNADPNVRSNRKWIPVTVLMEACWDAMASEVPNPAIVKLLLQHKAEVNSPEGDRSSPLTEAIKASCYDKNLRPRTSLCKDYTIVKMILDAGANIEWKNNVGETALFPALRANHKDLVEELIANYNADSLVRNNAGQSLIKCSTANTPMAEMLQENQELRYHVLTSEEGSPKRSYEEAFGPRDTPQQPHQAPLGHKNTRHQPQQAVLRHALRREAKATDKTDTGKKETVKKETGKKETVKKETVKKETVKKDTVKKAQSKKAKSKKNTDKKGKDKVVEDKADKDKEDMGKKEKDDVDMDKMNKDQVDMEDNVDMEKMNKDQVDMEDNVDMDKMNKDQVDMDKLDEQSPKAKRPKPPPNPFKVVQFGSIEEIKHLFEVDKEDYDQMDQEGQNCVHEAAKRKTGAFEVIQYLTDTLGVHAMFCDNTFSWNPLFHAVVNGNEDCIQFLVEHHCDPNHMDKSSFTVIMHAVTEGATTSVKMLHSLGAKIDLKTPVGGDNLAHIAASKGFDEILDFLLENGLPGTEENDQGYTPLHLAKTGQCVEMLLDHGATVEQVDKYGNGPIFTHIRNHRVNSVQKLLERQCSPECSDMDSRTCIMAAVEADGIAMVKLLIEFKADLAASDKKGCTAEKLAKRRGRKAILDVFRAENEKKKDILAKQYYHDMQLKASVCGGSPLPQLRQWINKYGSNPQRLWGSGKMETLLFSAVSRATADVCDVVLFLIDEHGLDPGFVDLQGETALFNAVAVNKLSNLAVTKLLLDRNCDPNKATVTGITVLFEAVRCRNADGVKLLLEKKVDVNHRNIAGESPLFWARSADMARTLVDAGADTTALNAKGRSCMFGATDLDTVKLLLEHGCGLDTVDTIGETCLFEAVKHTPDTALVEVLLDKGADPTRVNHMGQTCLHVALAEQNLEVARMLVEKYQLDPFLKDKDEVSPFRLAEQNKMDSFIGFINERQKRIKEEKARQLQASQELMRLLARNATLEEVKTFVDTRSPSVNWVCKERAQSLVFYAVAKSSTRSDDESCELVKYLIEIKVDPTLLDKFTQSALFYACLVTGPKTCRVLIESKCGVNQKDLLWETPLSYAARSKKDTKMDIINLLFEEKADPNISNAHGGSELMRAVEEGDLPVIHALVEHSANLETTRPSENNRTALFAASENKTTEVLEILLAAGANVNAVDSANRTPLFVCHCAQGARLLVKAGANPNHQSKLGRNALFECKSVSKLHTLVELKCDIALLDLNGQTCLFAGMLHGGAEICESLIRDYRLDPFQADANGHSCVDVARTRLDRPEFLQLIDKLQRLRLDLEDILQNKTLAEFEQFGNPGDLTYIYPETNRHYGFVVASRDPKLPDTAEFLKRLQNGQCDLTAVDSLGRTCFFTAAQSGNIEAMQYLMEVRCHVNENDKDQKTPLFAAARGGDLQSFQFLIENHASKNARSEILGESLIFDAIRSGKEDMVKAVLDISKNPEFELELHNFEQMTPLIEAVVQNNVSVLEMVLSYGVAVDTKGPQHKSALFHCKSVSACRMLLSRRADANMVDVNGRTPLFEAVTRGDRETVRVLVGVGAEVNWRDYSGRTPVFCCVEEEDDNIVLQTLLDLGADLDVTDANGQTPLTLAKGSKKRKNVSSFVTNLKKRIVVKPAKKSSPVASKGVRRDVPVAVRLAPMKKLDGRLEHCCVTFYESRNPDVIVPFGSEEYQACWGDLKRENPELLGLLEYPLNTPWTTGV